MTEEISSLGNLTYGNMQAQNITSQFIDTQSRLNAYRIEESRLLSMLEKAETVADMITIETRLSRSGTTSNHSRQC
jgi:predicted site-specific integrase-resolvase